ncbi:MAG: Rne/Rng family ribonuclease [Bacteroidetes bacterium]|nr:Rne/Rng family ribonuclease [Bacteroidota bacterium]
MNNELIINSSPSEITIALIEDKRLVEIHKERTNKSFSVGDIYMGRVRKIIPGLNAAFVDVGYEKDAFLHYLDLGAQFKSLSKFVKAVNNGKHNGTRLENFQLEGDIEKTGKITNILSSNLQILVQIAKEPISSKGPRITSEISLPGRYIVIIPFSEKISISQKIKEPEERKRLKRLITSIRPANFGIIVRTAAEHKKVAELDADLNDLMAKWDSGIKQLRQATPRQKIIGELARTSAILRDILNPSFHAVHVNDQTLFEEIRQYISTIDNQRKDIVQLYRGKEPIFEHFGVEKLIKSSFGKTVNVKGGAYLVIEHTEAMHVIDVNSGHRMNAEENQEFNALDVNMEAAAEVGRQLRLRDMGGIIVIDFIDMLQGANRKKLYDHIREVMKNDRAKHNILPPSKFGLVQITRQRVRPEMNIETIEKCPMCSGKGEIQPSILFTDELENNIRYILQEQNEKSIQLVVHPYIYAYLTKGIFSLRWKWAMKYKKRIRLQKLSSYHFFEYHFFNMVGEEIKL